MFHASPPGEHLEDLLNRGASPEEWSEAIEAYPDSFEAWERVARDPRTPPEVLVKLLNHPWHRVAEEAAKTLAGHPEATDEQLTALAKSVFEYGEKPSLFRKAIREEVYKILTKRPRGTESDWEALAALWALAEL